MRAIAFDMAMTQKTKIKTGKIKHIISNPLISQPADAHRILTKEQVGEPDVKTGVARILFNNDGQGTLLIITPADDRRSNLPLFTANNQRVLSKM